MHSKPVRILKSFEESQAFDFQYECGEVLSCPHSPDDSPIPFPDSSPQHSESSDDSCDYTDRLAFFPAEIKEDFESIASILVTLRSAPVIKNVSSPLPSSKENVFVLSEPQEDTKMMVSSSEKEDQHMQSDSGSGKSEIEEVEIDCDDEWNERIDGTESKGCINKGSGGFACEKHKRWKKRCPSWCPMRKENFKNIKNSSTKLSSEHPMESPNSSGSEGQSRRKRNYAKITSSSSMEDFITISNTPIRVSPVNTIACQFHAQLHARCPLNCPDRRVKTNVRKKQKKAEESDGRRATI